VNDVKEHADKRRPLRCRLGLHSHVVDEQEGGWGRASGATWRPSGGIALAAENGGWAPAAVLCRNRQFDPADPTYSSYAEPRASLAGSTQYRSLYACMESWQPQACWWRRAVAGLNDGSLNGVMRIVTCPKTRRSSLRGPAATPPASAQPARGPTSNRSGGFDFGAQAQDPRDGRM